MAGGRVRALAGGSRSPPLGPGGGGAAAAAFRPESPPLGVPPPGRAEGPAASLASLQTAAAATLAGGLPAARQVWRAGGREPSVGPVGSR